MVGDEWVDARLGDCVDLLTGFPFRSSEFSSDLADVRLLRGDNIGQGTLRWNDVKRWPKSLMDGLDEYAIKAGDVVLAMDRPWIDAGLKFAVATAQDVPSLLVQRVARLRAKSTLDQRFLKYVIAGKEFTDYLVGAQTGTAVPHVSGPQIRAFTFALPPLLEQRAVARVLGSIDDKIELNHRMNQTLEQIAQALFKSWFVDFDPVRAKADGRWKKGQSLPWLPAEMWEQWPIEFEESEIGEIPRGWGVRPLAEVASITRGISYRGEDLAESDTALVNLKCAGRGGVYREDGLKAYCGPFKGEQIVRAGDVVVSHTDVTQRAEVIGRAYRVRPSSRFGRLVASLDMAIVRPTAGGQTREYLAFALADERFRDYTYGYTNGTTVLHLSSQALPDYSHLIPSPQIVRQFSEIVGLTLRLTDEHALESDTLSKTRDALLPKLLSGEIRIGRAEPQ